MSNHVLSVVPRGYLPDLCGGLELCARVTLEKLVEQGSLGHIAAAGPNQFAKNLYSRVLRKMKGPYADTLNIDRHKVHVDPWHPVGLGSLEEKLAPSYIICHVAGCNESVQQVLQLNKPTLFYIHGSNIPPQFASLESGHPFKFACESAFIQQRFEQQTGQQIEIIRPILAREKFTVSQSGDKILVVNPHPMKGGQRVAELAKAMPQRSFLVVGGWANTQGCEEVQKIEAQLAGLTNVERLGNLEDVRAAFEQAHCLLMPCLVEEAYGRAAAEAIIAGLPVVASNRGALPETVGDGGVCLDPEAPLTLWIKTLERLFEDRAHYQTLVEGALSTSYLPDRRTAFIENQLSHISQQLIQKG